MNQTFKTILFSLLVTAFITASALMILYAQGYAFDFEKRELIKTGGIYVKTSFTEASVFVNNKFIDKTDFLKKEVFMQRLLPDDYHIRVEKENYHTWEKTLPVKEQIVTRAENIVFFPNEINFVELNKDTKNFFISKDLILILDTKNNLLNQDKTVLSFGKYTIKEVIFSPDNSKIIVKTKENKNYLLSLDNQFNAITNLANDSVFNSNDAFIFSSNGQIFEQDIKTAKKTLIADGDSFVLLDNSLYFFRNKVFYRKNLLTKNEEKLTDLDGENYELIAIQGRLFLNKDNQIFYLFNQDKKQFDKFLEGSDIQYIDLKDKVMFSTGYELWLWLLKDFDSPFFAKETSLIFFSRFSQKISNLNWINEDYFCYTIENKLRISEIDNRDKINYFEIDQNPISKTYFDFEKKDLYILKDNTLLVSTKLIP